MREREYTFLNHRAFHIVVLDNDVLLQDFDGVQLVGSLSLRQQDLELIIDPEVEMQSNSSSRTSRDRQNSPCQSCLCRVPLRN